MHYPLTSALDDYDAVIVANGDYPTHPIPLGAIDRAHFICCCDNAARTLCDHGRRPDAVVGDGDSLPPTYKQKLEGVWHHVAEQDDNDQTKATRFCVSRGFKRIAYVGCTGKREDHALGNISLIVNYMQHFNIQPVMLTNYGSFLPVMGDNTIGTFPGQQVSVFDFGCTKLITEGLKWPTTHFEEWWQGTLNEATGNAMHISTNGPCLIYRTYEGKDVEVCKE